MCYLVSISGLAAIAWIMPRCYNAFLEKTINEGYCHRVTAMMIGGESHEAASYY